MPRQSQTFSLVASALLHVLVVLVIAAGLVDPSSGGGAAALAVTPETLTFQLVEAPPRQVVETPGREGEPDRPTALVSERSTAAADRAPGDLPEGEAYSEGPGAAPTARPGEGGRDAPAGAPVPPRAAATSPSRAQPSAAPPRDAAERGDAESASEARDEAPRSDDRADTGELALRRPADDGRGREAAASTLGDPRLAVPRREVAVPPIAPGGAGARGMPQVDNRLTRARLEGDFSLSTYEWDYAPYMLRLKREIEDYTWQILPSAFWYGIAAWTTQVQFVIRPDGTLESIVIAGHRGVLDLRHVAQDAVTGAADFEPLPPGFPDPKLTVTGNFYFNTFPPGDDGEEAPEAASGEAPRGRGAGRS